MNGLQEFILAYAQGNTVTLNIQIEAALKFGLSLSQVEEVILALDRLPSRYERNWGTFTVGEQRVLLRGNVAVVGCGGLGGYVIEEMARLGVGHITAIDPDVFEEHNLNRQLLATISDIGKPKVQAASERVREINPATTVTMRMDFLTEENGQDLLRGADVVIDALDTIPSRLHLADVCSAMTIPIVHGSIAGWYGQIAVQMPGEDTVKKIFSNARAERGVEKDLGALSFTTAFVGSLQAAEACKVLLKRDSALKRKMLSINLLDMDFSLIPL